MTTTTYKHRDATRAATSVHPDLYASGVEDFPSLAADPPPVHVSGLCVGKRRATQLNDLTRPEGERGSLLAMFQRRYASRDERGSSTIGGIAIACFMFALTMIGVGSFMLMLQEASLR